MRKFFIAAAVAVASLISSGSSAQAAFALRYSTDGGVTFTTVTDGGAEDLSPGIANKITVDVDGLSISASSNTFLSASKSTLDLGASGTLGLDNNGNPTITAYNLVIQSSVTDVPTLPPPQSLGWTFTSSSQLDGGTLVETAQGWVAQSNVAFDTSTPITTGPLSPPAKGSTQFNFATTYSWTAQYTLVGHLNSDGVGNQLSADLNQSITNPAPAGLVLALTGMPLLGFGAWVRRRRTVTAA